MIKAITFDLWDTIVDDDSDEPKRAAQGFRSKKEERRHILWTALNEVEATDPTTVALAYDVADASFNIVWKELFINWTVEQRIRAILNGLGRRLPTDLFNRVVKDTGDMEVNIPPNAIEGVKEALADLASRYKLCIVSDAIVTPGTGLRRILEQYELKQYFSGFAFSDEVGHSKPHRSMFDSAASQLGVKVEEMLHIGDRDHNDIKGPHALGMKAILFTATRDADKDHTTADAIVNSYADLPAAIDLLAANSK
ncbi:HAD family hydrolase [Kiloniella laminariae]|uniref:HAD family hydrolase n=1 Tax=Kiloniella laminariae TaxID=454162 RepID=UPI000363A2D8|nr:HAD family hydrolase [Kiloniella laminariae]